MIKKGYDFDIWWEGLYNFTWRNCKMKLQRTDIESAKKYPMETSYGSCTIRPDKVYFTYEEASFGSR